MARGKDDKEVTEARLLQLRAGGQGWENSSISQKKCRITQTYSNETQLHICFYEETAE